MKRVEREKKGKRGGERGGREKGRERGREREIRGRELRLRAPPTWFHSWMGHQVLAFNSVTTGKEICLK